MRVRSHSHVVAFVFVVLPVIALTVPGRGWFLGWSRSEYKVPKDSVPPLARSLSSRPRADSFNRLLRRQAPQDIEAVLPALLISPEKSPKKYKKLITRLIELLEEFPGLPKDGGSMIGKGVLKLGCKFSIHNPWIAPLHLVFLTNPTGSVIYGWAKCNERKLCWRVEYVWINRKFRKLGLGRYIMSYIESMAQFPKTRHEETPDDLKLLSGGVNEFYDKLGYKRSNSGGMFLREDPSTHGDNACTHMKKLEEGSRQEFMDMHKLVGFCRNGFKSEDDFHSHVVILPDSYIKKQKS